MSALIRNNCGRIKPIRSANEGVLVDAGTSSRFSRLNVARRSWVGTRLLLFKTNLIAPILSATLTHVSSKEGTRSPNRCGVPARLRSEFRGRCGYKSQETEQLLLRPTLVWATGSLPQCS